MQPVCNSANLMNKRKTICILTGVYPLIKPWDPEGVHSGIAGSEEAVIYMSKELANLGYKVLVLGDPPEGSPHSKPDANPRFVNVYTMRFLDKVDIAISWRMPLKGLELRNFAHKVYLWPHDLLSREIPLTEKHIDAFDDVLWLSKWQRKQYASICPTFAKFKNIFGNGVDLDQFPPCTERTNPYSCIYASNYVRGLEVLLDLWPSIREKQPLATLDIYYGWQPVKEWQPWGRFSEEIQSKMQSQIKTLPGVKEHGKVGHVELNRAFAASSFWTYPCLKPETFCITALRAQYAGAVPIVLEMAALRETVRSGFRCQKREQFLDTVLQAFQKAKTITLEDRRKMGDFVRDDYSWKVIASKWKKLFEKVS